MLILLLLLIGRKDLVHVKVLSGGQLTGAVLRRKELRLLRRRAHRKRWARPDEHSRRLEATVRTAFISHQAVAAVPEENASSAEDVVTVLQVAEKGGCC